MILNAFSCPIKHIGESLNVSMNGRSVLTVMKGVQTRSNSKLES